MEAEQQCMAAHSLGAAKISRSVKVRDTQCRVQEVQSMKLPHVLSSGITGKHNFFLQQCMTTCVRIPPSRKAHQKLGVQILLGAGHINTINWLIFSFQLLWRSEVGSQADTMAHSPRHKSQLDFPVWPNPPSKQGHSWAGHSKGLEITSQELRANIRLIFD